MLAAPAAVGVGPAIDVFVRGLDSHPYMDQVTAAPPSAWSPLGGVVSAPLSATFNTSGVTLFARGLDAQLYVKTFTNSWSDWSPLGGVPLASPPVALSSPEITTPPPAARRPASDSTRARHPRRLPWRPGAAFSPFTSVGIYIGGINRACRNRALDSPGWVQTVVAQGWRLIPIYVGLQAPCISFGSAQLSRDLFTAIAQGQQAGERRRRPRRRRRPCSRRSHLLRHGGLQQFGSGLCRCGARFHCRVGTPAAQPRLSRRHVQQLVLRHSRSGSGVRRPGLSAARCDLDRGLEQRAQHLRLPPAVPALRRGLALPSAHPPIPRWPQRVVREE